jgi:hypothetical protein
MRSWQQWSQQEILAEEHVQVALDEVATHGKVEGKHTELLDGHL